MKWQSEAARSEVCSGWERGVWILWLLPVFSNLCVVTHCHVEVGLHSSFLGGQILMKCCCKVLRVWMYRSELIAWPHGIISPKIIPFCITKISGHDCPCWMGSHSDMHHWAYSLAFLRTLTNSAVINSIDTLYIFNCCKCSLFCHKKFCNNLLFKMHIAMPHHAIVEEVYCSTVTQ